MKKNHSKYLLLLLPLVLVSCASYSFDVPTFNVKGVTTKDNEYISCLSTFVTLKMYNKDQLDEVKNEFQDELRNIHKVVDSYHDYNKLTTPNVYNINHSNEKTFVIDDILYSLIEDSIEMSILSEGIFNFTMGSVIDLWKDQFESGLSTNVDPSKEELDEALKSIVPYQKMKEVFILDKASNTLTINYDETKPKPILNFGAISKGYALDLTSDIFNPSYPAIISAGSSSISFKGKYQLNNRDYYLINCREPNLKPSETNEEFVQLKIYDNTNISSSGDYEKFFYNQENILRHHILDPKTGYSNNYHASVMVESKLDSYILDGLSTVLMNIEDIKDIDKMVSKFEEHFGSEIPYLVFDRDESNYTMYYSSNIERQITNKMTSKITKKIKI